MIVVLAACCLSRASAADAARLVRARHRRRERRRAAEVPRFPSSLRSTSPRHSSRCWSRSRATGSCARWRTPLHAVITAREISAWSRRCCPPRLSWSRSGARSTERFRPARSTFSNPPTSRSPIPARTIAAAVPEGACAITDEPSILITANRFVSKTACPALLDSYYLWLSHDKDPPPKAPPFDANLVAEWQRLFSSVDYVVLSANPFRIPWTSELSAYFNTNFHLIATAPDANIYRRIDSRVEPDAFTTLVSSWKPDACASRWNICTVSSENWSRSLPRFGSFFSRSCVTVMMSQPISSACTMLRISRGLAQINSICGCGARISSESRHDRDRVDDRCRRCGRRTPRRTPAGPPARHSITHSTCATVISAVTFTFTPSASEPAEQRAHELAAACS